MGFGLQKHPITINRTWWSKLLIKKKQQNDPKGQISVVPCFTKTTPCPSRWVFTLIRTWPINNNGCLISWIFNPQPKNKKHSHSHTQTQKKTKQNNTDPLFELSTIQNHRPRNKPNSKFEFQREKEGFES